VRDGFNYSPAFRVRDCLNYIVEYPTVSDMQVLRFLYRFHPLTGIIANATHEVRLDVVLSTVPNGQKKIWSLRT